MKSFSNALSYQVLSIPLSEIVKKKIVENGPISFCDFMEMALYYPELGYYTSSKDKIGASGDYYTSPDFTPVFGNMIGVQIEEMWQLLGKEPFTIVEYGAGNGSLCDSILKQLKHNRELYEQLNYCIIEKSPVMRGKEEKVLQEKVSWYKSIKEIPLITGCILSNEVVDNFPVHKVLMQDELMEVFVNYDNDFIEELKPASQELKEYFSALNVVLPYGYCTEVNLNAIEWITEIASRLKKGFILTIDYGYPTSELYAEPRNSGTLVCYNNHKINYYPLHNIGAQDITSHINFSALSHYGNKVGLETCGFTNQANFLIALGLEDFLQKAEKNMKTVDIYKKTIMLHTLIVDMGRKYKVLIQQKELIKPNLSGLKFSKNL